MMTIKQKIAATGLILLSAAGYLAIGMLIYSCKVGSGGVNVDAGDPALCEGHIVGYQSHTGPPDLDRCERVAIRLAEQYPYPKEGYATDARERHDNYCDIKHQPYTNCTDLAILIENDCSAFIDDGLSDIIFLTGGGRLPHTLYRIRKGNTYWLFERGRKRIEQGRYLKLTGRVIRAAYDMDDHIIPIDIVEQHQLYFPANFDSELN